MAEGDGEEVVTGGEVEILAAKVRVVHDRIIRTTGGVLGEKPADLLSACARPFQSAGGVPAYPLGDVRRYGFEVSASEGAGRVTEQRIATPSDSAVRILP